MSEVVDTVKPPRRLSRRVVLLGGGVAVAAAGAAAALVNGPRRADGLPAAIDLAGARALGDGFFIVDGWVLTADDLDALKAAAPAALP